MSESSDDELLVALQNGDAKGIEKLYLLLWGKIRKYILSNSGDETDARDILQKTMLQLALRQEANRLTINSSLEAYGFTIARNLWRKQQKNRKEWVTTEDHQAHITEEAALLTSSLEQEKWDLFHEKLAMLSENCRLLLQRVFDQQPYADIAKELLYASENVVRQRIFKCKKKLKELVQQDVRYKSITDGA